MGPSQNRKSIRASIRYDVTGPTHTRFSLMDSTKELPHSHIQIDEHGDWHHAGNRIFRPEILELLYSKLDLLPNGEFILDDGGQPCQVDVADTPFVVSRVDIEKSESGNERIRIRLKNITRSEILDPDTLRTGKNNVLYCRVLDGRFPARFSRPAYYQLAEFLREDDEGQNFFITLNGSKHFIKNCVSKFD